MNKAEKSLRWVVNQIPDFKPTTNEEKMLVAIKLYSEAGAEEIKRLESENAALREQISKMIMPPCTLGDTLYITSFCFGDGYDERGKAVHKIGWQITETKVDEKNFYRMCDLVRNKKAFFSSEAAVARLAELKGEEKNG